METLRFQNDSGTTRFTLRKPNQSTAVSGYGIVEYSERRKMHAVRTRSFRSEETRELEMGFTWRNRIFERTLKGRRCRARRPGGSRPVSRPYGATYARVARSDECESRFRSRKRHLLYASVTRAKNA